MVFPFARGKLRVIATLCTAFLLGAGIVATFGYVRGGNRDTTAFVGFDPTTINPDDPSQPLLVGGQQVSLGAAITQAGFPIYRPNTAAASDETLSEVWIDSTTVGLRYASGVRVYITRWPTGKDPKASLAAQPKEMGAGKYLEINGYPAWVGERDTISTGNPRFTFVEVAIGSIDVLFQTSTLPLRDLIEIARSAD